MGGHLRRCKQNPNNDLNKRRKITTTPIIDEHGVLNSPVLPNLTKRRLERHFDATVHISGTLYVTSDMYMKEVFVIGQFIRHSCGSVDFSTMSMIERMRVKYEKHWGNPDSVNMLLLIAIVLNPMQKIEYVNYFLDYLFREEKGGKLKSKLSKYIKLLYQQYQSSEEANLSQNDKGIFCYLQIYFSQRLWLFDDFVGNLASFDILWLLF
ncbi:hypothetical protein Ahy_A10g049844 [Arachis hypogaea]|uniref:hAT-like transposase RNase-H fold domain-containing protein n=1 Tax=Arachis hypogaea TaxID=3818 RepID=A0A445B810_ARAHY|nr:hypothetical protein Ahy_A10g049844 [Arachis hypogaea]